MRLFLILLLSTSWAILCTAQPAVSYEQTIRNWHQNRIESLKSPTGWLNLAGLFWLEPGRNNFGAAKTNTIIFPEKSSPVLGYFTVNPEEVWVDIAPDVVVTSGGAPVTSLRLFPTDTQVVLQSGALRWFVVKRGDRYAVRLRDLQHPALQHFSGVPTYPIDSTWRVSARLEKTSGAKIPITNILGQTTLQYSPGTLVFNLHGTIYRLDAIEDDGKLFILFADQTSGTETYGTGRFLYADLPDANGLTTLDFNYAINPPCAFTEFATCPLPPKQNALAIAVTAGEKNYGKH